MQYRDPRIEEMPEEDLRKVQYKLLKSLVCRLYSFSPFYHDRMKELNVHPDNIRELSDIKKLPFMFKRDLRDSYPNRIFTAAQDELYDITFLPELRVNPPLSAIPKRISKSGLLLLPGGLQPSDSGGAMSSRSVTDMVCLPEALGCITGQSESVQPYSRQVSEIPSVRLN